MKRQKAQISNIGIFGKAVVTATLLGCTAIPQGVHAGQAPDVVTNGIYVTILSPKVDVSDPNKQIEISAFYQAAPITGGITTLELYVDGQQEAIKKLDSPENKGVVSFVINPGTLTPGTHHVVVRVSASDAEIASAKTGIDIAQPVTEDLTPQTMLGGDTSNGSAPAVAIMTPDANATVTGTVDIKVDAHDNSGKSPYVSLFVDHTFKTLRNFPPYDFAWDTTRVSNGYHTIEVWGYNDDQAVGHAQPLTVFVNNPEGRTTVRHDLLDTVPTKVLINETRPKPVSVQYKAPAVKTSASLASGQSASASKIDKLASADIDENQSSLSEETQLMSPFLPARTPVMQRVAIASPVHKSPSLAFRTASASTGSSEQLSQIAPQSPDLSNAILLANPIIEDIAPSPVAPTPVLPSALTPTAAAPVSTKPLPVHAPVITPVQVKLAVSATAKPIPAALKPATPVVAAKPIQQMSAAKPVHIAALNPAPASAGVAVKPVQAASANVPMTEPTPLRISPIHANVTDIAPQAAKPVQIASASISQTELSPDLASVGQQSPYFAHLDSEASSELSDTQASALEEPTIENIREGIKMALATGKPVQASAIGAAKLASASINSASLYSPDSTLQAPDMPARRVLNFVSSHRVGTRLQPLGSSPAGFAPDTVQRFQLVLNNRMLLLNQPLQDKNNLLFAPFRQIFENEGGVMSWNPALRQVHALNGSRDIEVTIGSKNAIVNQEAVTLNASPYIVKGHTMIPLAFVPIALDATVSFDPATGHIVISSKD